MLLSNASLFVSVLLAYLVDRSWAQGPVNDYCLNCICQEGCAITYNFWLDAGKPTVNGDNANSEAAYENCFQSYDCSARAIQNYMYRYQKDCNNDGTIDCYDHAAIHRHGADGCYGKDADLFQFQVYNCLNKKK